MQELQDTQEIQEIQDMQDMNEVKDNEEIKEIVKPIKKVVFKKNTQEMLGVKVNLTKDKEYEVLSVIVPVQPKITPSVDNTVLYLIKDDNGEKNYFRTNFFENKEM